MMPLLELLNWGDIGNEQQDNEERQHVEGADGGEHGGVAHAMVEHVAGDLAEDDAAHRAAEADQAGNGADGVAREDIDGQNHDEGRPGLLAEEREAEEHNRDFDGRPGDEEDLRHEGGAESEGDAS